MAGPDGDPYERSNAANPERRSGGADRPHGLDLGKAELGQVSGDRGGCGRSGAAGDTEVTPEMLDAGEQAIWEEVGGAELGGAFSARDLAAKVFSAMRGVDMRTAECLPHRHNHEELASSHNTTETH